MTGRAEVARPLKTEKGGGDEDIESSITGIDYDR